MEETTKKVATIRKGGVSGTDREPTEAINNNDREGYLEFFAGVTIGSLVYLLLIEPML